MDEIKPDYEDKDAELPKGIRTCESLEGEEPFELNFSKKRIIPSLLEDFDD